MARSRIRGRGRTAQNRRMPARPAFIKGLCNPRLHSENAQYETLLAFRA
jgi:hypothetical protein